MTQHIVTHSLNEPVMLPLWLKYHGRFAPKAKLHVIFTEAFPGELQMLQAQFPDVVFYPWAGPSWGCDVSMTGAVVDYVSKMYSQGAKVVIHLDADEFLIPVDPNKTLGDWMDEFEPSGRRHVRPQGYQVFHNVGVEGAMFTQSDDVLHDRNVCYSSVTYSKPCVTAEPTIWNSGFHRRMSARNRGKIHDDIDPTLNLIHLATIDIEYLWAKQLSHHAADSKYNPAWKYAPGVPKEDWITFCKTCVQPWNKAHGCYANMRNGGIIKVPDYWRGKILR